MTENFDNLSTRLKYALSKLGVSQTELARRINVKPQVIQYLCSSKSHKSKFSSEIAEALNIDFSWLATGRGDIPQDSNLSISEKIPLLSFEQLKAWKIKNLELYNLKIQTWLPKGSETNFNSYAVEINDRAMAPRFDHSTIIIIEPKNLKEIEDKNFILVYLKEENFIIFRQYDMKTQRLLTLNKNLYKNIQLKEEDIVLGICREARWRI